MADHIQEIFRTSFDAYARQYGPLPPEHHKVAHAIMTCRTDELGGHIWRCDACGNETTIYNSCRNRHCPRCQAYASAQWVQDRVDDLLPVPYFHIVFTIPAEMNPIALRNKKVFYSLMFKAVSRTLAELSRNRKFLGGIGGAIAILHTWGQNLMDHPHIHCVVPGLALSDDRTRVALSKNNFLFPVPVMRKLFRGKMMDLLKKAVSSHEISFPGAIAHLCNPGAFDALAGALYRKEWVVYAKRPFAGPQAVIKYLGAYTHRIAISNKRIQSVCESSGAVTFSYKDYAHGCCRKSMTLNPVEFIRRFLLHVVPTGFMRIRHYGFLCNRLQRGMLDVCRALLGMQPVPDRKKEKPVRWHEIILSLSGKDPRICPRCQKELMHIGAIIPRNRRRFAKAGTGG